MGHFDVWLLPAPALLERFIFQSRRLTAVASREQSKKQKRKKRGGGGYAIVYSNRRK